MASYARVAREHPTTSLGAIGVFGFLASGAAAWLLVTLANAFGDKTLIASVDDGVTNWLIGHGTQGADTVFRAVSLFGGPLLAVIMVGAGVSFAVRRDWLRFNALLFACLGGGLLNLALRAAFLRARPIAATQFVTAAQGLNFPSGHAMIALIGYGMLAALAVMSGRLSRMQSAALIAFAALFIAVIGFTRIYLGVHFLSDVVAGYAAGAVWLIACIAGYRVARSRAAEPALATATA